MTGSSAAYRVNGCFQGARYAESENRAAIRSGDKGWIRETRATLRAYARVLARIRSPRPCRITTSARPSCSRAPGTAARRTRTRAAASGDDPGPAGPPAHPRSDRAVDGVPGPARPRDREATRGAGHRQHATGAPMTTSSSHGVEVFTTRLDRALRRMLADPQARIDDVGPAGRVGPHFLLDLTRHLLAADAETIETRPSDDDGWAALALTPARGDGRRKALVRLTGKLLAARVDPEVVHALMQAQNSARNVPPLDVDAVATVVDWVCDRHADALAGANA